MEEVENMRHRNKEYDYNKVLSHLGLPEYEYVNAQNYDYLLPMHLTYGKDQTVKIHNAKIMNCEILILYCLICICCFSYDVNTEAKFSGMNRKVLSFVFSLANLYTCIDSWPDVHSLPRQLGEIGGLALNNANDELVVFHRGTRKWENK